MVDLYPIQLLIEGSKSYRGTYRRRVVVKQTHVISLITKSSCDNKTQCRTRSYVRGYRNDKYLRELSVGRILNHDYNTSERVYKNPPTSDLQRPDLQEINTSYYTRASKESEVPLIMPISLFVSVSKVFLDSEDFF